MVEEFDRPGGPRAEKVAAIANGALVGMLPYCEDATVSEVFSAGLTVMSQFTKFAAERGADKEALKSAIGILLLECAERGD